MVKTLRGILKLLLLLKYHGPIVGRTRFQKLVFLLQTKYGINFGYNFIPYFYGPYSKKLQIDIDWLGAHRSIKIGTGYEHSLTSLGHKFVDEEDVDEEGSKVSSEALKTAVEQLREIPTSELIREAKSLI